MPCQSYEDPRDTAADLKSLRDKLARIACAALTHIEESGDGLEVLILKNPEVADWWRAHKEADRKAQERARREMEREQLRKGALAKLSDAEKKALGIRG